MITTIICFINCFITMFGGKEFIKSYDMAFCCALLELIITAGIAWTITIWKEIKGD